ncbi:hypothetical protein NC651_013008 [Populus alba x Populus x berolinensis]|nr:hypothetical protein NC651_013008 [Populus alba x Populus x berolinensis]
MGTETLLIDGCKGLSLETVEPFPSVITFLEFFCVAMGELKIRIWPWECSFQALIRDKELGKKGKGELEEALKKFQDLARGFLEENPTGCSPPKLAWDDLRQKRFEWVLMKDLICWLVYTDDFYQSKDQTEDSTKGIEAVQIYC